MNCIQTHNKSVKSPSAGTQKCCAFVRPLPRRYDLLNMKSIISLIIVYFISNASFAADGTECKWSPAEKKNAWESIKFSLREKDQLADDFYDLTSDSNSLKFWEEGGKCQFIPSLNPNPKNDYLDGGVVVNLNKETQQVLEVVEIAW